MNVFITGASTGIGAALAQEYARRGAVVGLVARRMEGLERLRQSLHQPSRHAVYALDVADASALRQAAEAFMRDHGTPHVVIANAGISHGTDLTVPADIDVFDGIIRTNVIGTANTFAVFMGAMQSAGGGRLVAIASVAGIRGLPGASAYSASKSAVITLAESIRVELRATPLKVVTLVPGYIDTPMTQGNPYRMPFLMSADRFARRAVDIIAAGRTYAVIPWPMGVVARALRALPNSVYDRLFARAPRKPRRE